jgi:pimeloyl-ACP methyl ester carboxylesterase
MKYCRSSCSLRQGCFFFGLLLLSLVLSGCSVPIGVTTVSPQDSYNLRHDNAMGKGRASDDIKTVLQRYNLLELLDKDPLKAIQSLHDVSKTDDRRDILFVLSELSYLHGVELRAGSADEKRREAREFFLQAAVYAYFYLLGDDGREPPPTPYDSRFREACELYNRALWQAFPVYENNSLVFSGGTRHLPVGDLTLSLKTDTLSWQYDNFEGLFPADSYAVHGFTVRNRNPGMGLPLVGVTRKTIQSPYGGALPITAFLRMTGSLKDYQQGKSQAILELYSALDSAEVRVKERIVPLETDTTTPFAYRLNDAGVWSLGERRFLFGGEVPVHVLLIQPYERGRIPLVFVHGTASSPVWWAEMVNSLRADPELRKRYQIWFYQYNSNNMVTLSAAGLRESISGMINKLDPEGEDPALQNMVIIGHSQGGLLTKMAAVNPGNELWQAISDEDFDKADFDPQVKAMAHRLLLYQPLPFVRRVVFISTPHRGSFLTKNWVRDLVSFVVTLPYDIVVQSKNFLTTVGSRLKLPASMAGKIPTSIDGMSEDNPLLKKLAALPLAPGITGHSIVAVKPGMDIATGNDGVVEYKSAHLEGVESEFIVRAEHSCQSHPFTIEEVRRILLKHVGIDNAWQAPAEDAPQAALQLTQ